MGRRASRSATAPTQVGFDGTEQAPTSTYDERAKRYDRGTQDRRARRPFDLRARRVLRQPHHERVEDGPPGDRRHHRPLADDGDGRPLPSGALTLRTTDDTDVEAELAQAIGVVDDGPLLVTGAIPLQRADGEPFESRNRMTLCRCGQSTNKPLATARTPPSASPTVEHVGFADR